MKHRRYSFSIMLLILSFCLGFMITGCATSSDFKVLQEQVQQAMDKSDQALQEAQSAKAAVTGCSTEKDQAVAAAVRAEGAADRAEAAAQRAETAADKAEAIFMKMMNKK